MKKIFRFVQWCVLNGLLLLLGIWGLYFKINWTENIFLFFLWLNIILMVFPLFSPEVRKKLQERGRSVPEWLSVCYDLVLVCMLASVGRFVIAFFWFLQIGFEKYAFDTPVEEGKKDESRIPTSSP